MAHGATSPEVGAAGRGILVLAALALASCGPPPPPPAPDVVARAAALESYNAELKVSLSGPPGRGRLAVLLAFRRPDSLRIEVPGPAGARLIAVARGPRLTAVFPAERAAFEAGTAAADLEALLGVGLTPAEMMDLLVGLPSPRLREHRVRWGPALPRDVRATLPDGARIKVVVEDAQAGVSLPAAAFEEPRREGYRSVDADEARELLVGRRRKRP
jgi:hypothetical protein